MTKKQRRLTDRRLKFHTCWSKKIIVLFVLFSCLSPDFVPARQTRPASGASQSPTTQSLDELQRLFQNPPDDSRIMMRWWWFGPAVTKPQLEREMRSMKAGGIGGFEVQPVYPLALDDGPAGMKTLPFLSAGFLEALRFTAEKARELGLRFDLTLGSG